MPYILKNKRDAVDSTFKSLKVVEPGEAVYLFYKHYVKMWKETPRFSQAFAIRMLIERPERNSVVWDLSKDLMFKSLTKSEIQNARAMAYEEFKRRYLDVYENTKLEENGDV